VSPARLLPDFPLIAASIAIDIANGWPVLGRKPLAVLLLRFYFLAAQTTAVGPPLRSICVLLKGLSHLFTKLTGARFYEHC
jgi:hypothetical protein